MFPRYKMKLVRGQISGPVSRIPPAPAGLPLPDPCKLSQLLPQLCSVFPWLLPSAFSLNLGIQEIPRLNATVCHGLSHVSLFPVPSADHIDALWIWCKTRQAQVVFKMITLRMTTLGVESRSWKGPGTHSWELDDKQLSWHSPASHRPLIKHQ